MICILIYYCESERTLDRVFPRPWMVVGVHVGRARNARDKRLPGPDTPVCPSNSRIPRASARLTASIKHCKIIPSRSTPLATRPKSAIRRWAQGRGQVLALDRRSSFTAGRDDRALSATRAASSLISPRHRKKASASKGQISQRPGPSENQARKNRPRRDDAGGFGHSRLLFRAPI